MYSRRVAVARVRQAVAVAAAGAAGNSAAWTMERRSRRADGLARSLSIAGGINEHTRKKAYGQSIWQQQWQLQSQPHPRFRLSLLERPWKVGDVAGNG